VHGSKSLRFSKVCVSVGTSSLYSQALIVGVVLFQAGLAEDNAATKDATDRQAATTKPDGTVSQPPSNSPVQKDLERADLSTALVLGPGDEVDITVFGVPDLSEHTPVSPDGNISMPLIGYVRVAGLTSSEAEGAIEAQLRQGNFLNDPQVSLYVKDCTGGSISVAGEVAKPGPIRLSGRTAFLMCYKRLAGYTEKAANNVVISHRNSDSPITVELPRDPAELARNNVEIPPVDTVVVPAGPIVYVLGEVNKPGSYVLNSTNGLTVLQVVAVAGGPTHIAAMGGTKMVRRTPNGLQELRVPLKRILRAETGHSSASQ
jgi:polysaccharide biosynthesis/export protein